MISYPAPAFAEALPEPEFLRFVHSWCHGLAPEAMVPSGMRLW